MMEPRKFSAGFTLIELIVSIAIASLLLVGLQQILGTSLLAANSVTERTDLAREARFAMARMVDAVRGADKLLLPLPDNPKTNWDEHIRIETIPASAPQGSSTRASAVLAVTISRTQDLDLDGTFDADNDGDGIFDEDPSDDVTNDNVSGIIGIDDDGDGNIDEDVNNDDDEDGVADEDGWNGIDDDGDGLSDEDPTADMTGDSLSGIGGFDDDGDGVIDEGDKNDDDEDGVVDEDWIDPVVFYLNDEILIERRAVPWDKDFGSKTNGTDFVESGIADNVSLLRIERVPTGIGQQLVDITLELTGDDGENLSLNTRIRLGAAQ